MFPIGDTPNPKGIAWVNSLLIAINIGVFLLTWPMSQRPADPNDPNTRAYLEAITREAGLPPEQLAAASEQLSAYEVFTFEHGSRPAAPSAVDMLFSMFLHGGLLHLFGNMLFLWIYGNNVEFRLGPILYLLAYLVTGFAAAFGDILLRPGSNIPAVGASGAISGALGMYLIWFPHNRVRMLLFLPPVAIRPFDLPAPVVLLFYIVAENLLPAFLAGGGATGVAYGAHIGGFIAGAVLALLVALGARLWGGGKGKQIRAAATPADALAEADGLAASGDPRAALSAYQRAATLAPRGETAAEAHLGAARVLLEPMGQPAAAYQHLVRAMKSQPSSAQVEEVRRLMAMMQQQTRAVPLRMPGGLRFYP
ncbi:MAG: rhomboid family intramembrane serine protease [Acidobacteria bacterium]|jgi:membrane associated rhomboid family serine protease|nr:rhomboid family intramembrane serine protease [Acidobacteriota bacterium]